MTEQNPNPKNKPIKVDSGTAKVPDISFSSDNTTGLYKMGNADKIGLAVGGGEFTLSVSSTSAQLTDLYLQGKDPIEDRQDYIDIILRLPYVKNDNLKAVEVFERWKAMQDAFKEKENKL